MTPAPQTKKTPWATFRIRVVEIMREKEKLRSA
jgi:hypothetical protein